VKQVDLDFQHEVKQRFPEHRALFAAGEQIQALIAHPGWATVMDLLEGRISRIDGKLDGANPLTHVDYAHLHGQRRGLIAAQRKHEAGAESPAER
jgi:hypothetical protein